MFLSSHSSRPGYVQREFKLALDTLEEMPEDAIHTIPVRLEDCNVPERFHDFHWCNLFEPDGLDWLIRALHHGLQQRDKPLPAPPFSSLTNSIGMELILIPSDSFTMGSPDSDRDALDREKPTHSVTISTPFYLGTYPVTQAQWEAIMGKNPSRFEGNPNRPVENVSWENTQAFIQKLNAREPGMCYRLPTEAEWEYACRAGTETPRYHEDVNAIAWYSENSHGQTHPVGQKRPNAWGLHDMLGNVWEWCHDGRRQYTTARAVDPVGPTDVNAARVLRGGYWFIAERLVRAAYRHWLHTGYCEGAIGFRCASSIGEGP